jgi:transmembrane sensor
MDDPGLPRRASAWLIALREAPDNAALHAAHAAWLAQSAAHRQDWHEIVETYRVMGLVTPPHRARRSTPRRILAGALAAGMALALLPTALLHLRADATTATGEQRLIVLGDGSRVRLAPESAIAIADRHVHLLQGEAFFEVVHDERHPFRVTAGGTEVTDIGTAFDLALRAGGTEIAVREGLVAVDHARLGAGATLRIGPDGAARRDRQPPTLIGAWQQGQIIARDQSVADVVDAIRPYYHGLVVLRGDGLAHRPLTGVYRTADPVSALRAVAEGLGARFQRVTPWIVVIDEAR